MLERCCTSSDPAAWEQLVSIYTPLIHRWLSQFRVRAHDADELCQDIFLVVVRELPHFHREDRRGAFRRWLRTIAVHRALGFWRSEEIRPKLVNDQGLLELASQLGDPDTELSQMWDQQHDRHVLRGLLDLVKNDFAEQTWLAFERLVFGCQKPAAVAEELKISVAAVYAAKSRVLKRLRQEAQGLVD
jgi:RNA polymerase sigma-70 factor (ECF subfamily)